MQTRHTGILRAINNKNPSYNILTFPTHERYQSNLSHLPHTFYLWQGKGIKTWSSKYAQLPKNHILLDGSENQIPLDIKLDMVLSQGKHHYHISNAISRHLNIPLISIEHTLPGIDYTEEYIESLKSMKSDIDIFISDFSCQKWHYTRDDKKVFVIKHAIDTNVFNNRDAEHNDGRILTVVNDYRNRDWCCGWESFLKISNGLPINPMGDTPGFSKPAKDIDDLVSKYKKSSAFLNTSIISPIPMSLLEAAACACPIVTKATCEIPEIFTNGENCWLSNDESFLREKLIWCIKNPHDASSLGIAAREMIKKDFNIDAHILSWNRIFSSVYGMGSNIY